MVIIRLPFLWLSSLTNVFLGTAVPSISSPSPSNQPHYTFDELYNLQVKFFDNFIYPADVTQAKSINSTLLAKDVQGRIDITRTFDGRELNTEYLFGLFANLAADPNSISLLGVPISYEILHFTANEYVTSAATRFMFNFTSLGLIIPIEIDSWNTWNEAGQVTQYDGSFKYWQWTVDYIIASSAPLFNATSPTQAVEILTRALASSICNTAITYCNATNTQYSNMAACYQYLTQEVRFGEAYELGRNTLLCRMVHQNMVPFRPSVHCPHIGPSGGGYCTDDTTYIETVEENYFNISFIPHGY
ncbi:hypothetical protein BDZ45DRAFT_769025 [Acephala macrosclerotiorum]|nr:hypothetical protein BDZ45DRAFT_769025 [Acephala macrosclerotiorum]